MDPRIKKILDSIIPGKTVLNSGCAQNPELHQLLSKRTKKIIGIDIDKKALSRLEKKGFEVYLMDVEKISLKEQFDYIIAGELIEHLSNPGLFFQSSYKHLKKDGKIILTTPNISSIFLYFLIVFLNKTQDKSHVYYFDEKNLLVLISRFPYVIKKIEYIPPTIKFLGDSMLTKIIFFISVILANITYHISPRLSGSYLFIEIQKKND